MQPDLVRLGDQITDGENQSAFADQHAMPGPFGAERFSREGILRHGRAQPNDRLQSAIEIVGIVFGSWLHGRRYFPLADRWHSPLSLLRLRWPSVQNKTNSRRFL